MSHICCFCSKKYTNKSAFARHQLLCEFSRFNQRSQQVFLEETTDLPSHTSLVFAMEEMASKMQKMEQRLATIEKENSLVEKVKIAGQKWLLENVFPDYEIKDVRNKMLVQENHVEQLFCNKVLDVLQYVLKENLEKGKSPLAFIKGKLYSYTKSTGWSLAATQDLVGIFNKILQFLLEGLCKWRQGNLEELDTNDALNIKYNKTLGKLLEVNFMNDNTISRAKSCISNVVEYEVKNIVEVIVV